MGSAILFWVYVAVMALAAGLFVAAWFARFDTPRHKRLGATGVVLALTGIVVVLAATYALGWRVEQRWPDVVTWHRRVAYLSTALLVATAVSGARRWRLHPLIARVSLPVYLATLALALLGYRP